MKKITSLEEINIDLVDMVRRKHGNLKANELVNAWREWNIKQRKQDRKEKRRIENKIYNHLRKLGLWDDSINITGWLSSKNPYKFPRLENDKT